MLTALRFARKGLSMHDWLIKGALLFDGRGSAPIEADLAMADGVIAAVGRDLGPARRVVDARGLFLAPGLIDLHTHYDAQVLWDPALSPSSLLGVTTVVTGNCGFGLAPNTPATRGLLLRNLSAVEGMDLEALEAGVHWGFESFADYLAALRRRKPWLNMAVFAQHSTIRTLVMGEEASHRRATAAELVAMRREVGLALRAGAIGLASSFSPNHSGWQGLPMPSTLADPAELESLLQMLGVERRGVCMMATGGQLGPADLGELHARTGVRMFMSTVLTMHHDTHPNRALGYYTQAAGQLAAGREVYIQTSCQPLNFAFDLLDPYPMHGHASFEVIRRSDREAKLHHYADAAFRERFRNDLAQGAPGVLFSGRWDRILIARAHHPRVQRLEGRTLAAIAGRCGQDPLACFFDLALLDDLRTEFQALLYNADDEGVQPLLTHPAGVITLSDAGAHLKFMCDAGYGLHFLGHWVRDRQALSWSEGIARLTSEPAMRYRIQRRGRLEPGWWGDVLLFDPLQVGISALHRLHDLPAPAGSPHGSRLVRHPLGVAGVWVNGTRIVEEGAHCPGIVGTGQILDQFAWEPSA